MHAPRSFRIVRVLLFAAAPASMPALFAQDATPAQPPTTQPSPPVSSAPIAIVPLDNANGGPTVTGALQVAAGKAIIAASGSIASGTHTTEVALPGRGTLRVCASTTVKLAADTNAAAGDTPGLLMAMDAGAVEMSFATTHSADFLLTPDFRILIAGPGSSEVKVRLGSAGDTCIDNTGAPSDKSLSAAQTPGADAPYVIVSSLFDSGLYRVQPGQRVMFQHGNLHEVVDQEKEPCGCPPDAAKPTGNEFPLAQSQGLTPTAPPITPAAPNQGSAPLQVVPPLVYSSPAATPAAAQPITTAPIQGSAAPQVPPQKKQPSVFRRIGRFFKRVFGAE